MFHLKDVYNQAITISHSIVGNIRFGRQLYLEPIDMCSIQICKHVEDDENLLEFLHSVQDKYPYLYSHPVNVALISFLIGKWLNLDEKRLENLVRAGFLYDIGKAKIRDSLLNKAEELTLEEMEIIKSHSVLGYRILKGIDTLDPEVLQTVVFHHERIDGSGYPLGLKGDKINLFSRIIAVADTFDAIISTRTYSTKEIPLKAAEEIQANSSNQLDSSICHIFVNKLINYYTGREVRLSNEQVGSIVSINPDRISKPVVCCQNTHYDLSDEIVDLEIVEVL